MIQGEGVTSYMMRLFQVKDELVAIDVTILDSNMVRISLKGFTEEGKPFIKGIVAKEKFPDWNRLWDDFIQEELRDKYLHPKNKTLDDYVALAA